MPTIREFLAGIAALSDDQIRALQEYLGPCEGSIQVAHHIVEARTLIREFQSQ